MFDDFARAGDRALIAGVCAGLAARWGVSVSLVRLVFVLMFVPSVPLYLVLWLSTPREGDEDGSPRRGVAA